MSACIEAVNPMKFGALAPLFTYFIGMTTLLFIITHHQKVIMFLFVFLWKFLFVKYLMNQKIDFFYWWDFLSLSNSRELLQLINQSKQKIAAFSHFYNYWAKNVNGNRWERSPTHSLRVTSLIKTVASLLKSGEPSGHSMLSEKAWELSSYEMLLLHFYLTFI